MWCKNHYSQKTHCNDNCNDFSDYNDTIAPLDKLMILHNGQGCIGCVTCSYPELTEDHVLTSTYVKFFRTVTRNAVNKGV